VVALRAAILASVRDEFAVGWMVDGLDAYNLSAQLRYMAFDMFDELALRICGARNKHGSRIGDGTCYALKELVVLRCMAAAYAVGLVVDMAGRIVWVQHEAINLRHVEMKDARFMVIDPDDRVIVTRHDALHF
jgi:hypothetical protein